jgi:hypothetical protein
MRSAAVLDWTACPPCQPDGGILSPQEHKDTDGTSSPINRRLVDDELILQEDGSREDTKEEQRRMIL